MFTYDTEKGELCQIECWADEDREERYEDGDNDLIWIDRHHSNEYGDIENYISKRLRPRHQCFGIRAEHHQV